MLKVKREPGAKKEKEKKSGGSETKSKKGAVKDEPNENDEVLAVSDEESENIGSSKAATASKVPKGRKPKADSKEPKETKKEPKAVAKKSSNTIDKFFQKVTRNRNY